MSRTGILDNPVLVISVDTELAWGFILDPEHEILGRLRQDPQKGRTGINLFLELLEKYCMPATWAIVGQLFLSPEERRELVHREMPQFTEGWLDWNHHSSLGDDPLYCGEDVVMKIKACAVEQEIGLHSFSHVLFSRCSRRVAESEIELGIKAAQKFGVNFRSFVFPDNQIGHLGVLKDRGFRIYRSEAQGYWARMTRRVMNEFIPPPVVPRYEDDIWHIEGSVEFGYPLLPMSELPGARFGLRRAIWSNKVFHVYLHPWSLLLNQGVVRDLDSFLSFAARRRDEGRLEPMTMGGLADCLDSGRPHGERRQATP